MFVGLGFKVSAAPFQCGRRTCTRGADAGDRVPFSRAQSRGFAVFLRIFMTAFEPIGGGWEPVVWFSALLR